MNLDRLATTPTSIQESPPLRHWSELHFDVLELFDRHFPAENKLLTTAYQTHSSHARVFLQHSVLKRNRDRKPNLMTSEEVHFQARLNQDSLLWCKLTPETIKIHYTFGVPFGPAFLGGNIWKLYAGVGSTRILSQSSFKLGILGRFPQSGSFIDLRLRYNVGEFTNEQYFYLKGGWTWKQLTLGGLAVMDIHRNLLQKNDLKLGVQLGDNAWVGAQLEVSNFRNYKINYWRLGGYFDLLRVAYIQQFQGGTWIGGLKYEYNLESSQTKKIEAVIQCKPSQKGLTRIKTRINNNLQMALAGSYSPLEHIECDLGLMWRLKWQPTNVALAVSFGNK